MTSACLGLGTEGGSPTCEYGNFGGSEVNILFFIMVLWVVITSLFWFFLFSLFPSFCCWSFNNQRYSYLDINAWLPCWELAGCCTPDKVLIHFWLHYLPGVAHFTYTYTYLALCIDCKLFYGSGDSRLQSYWHHIWCMWAAHRF